MATIKVKFRPAAVGSGFGCIYYQIIHNRSSRQLSTELRIMDSEWDAVRAMVRVAASGERRAALLAIKREIRLDIDRLNRIIIALNSPAADFSVDDIVERFGELREKYSFFNFMEANILRLIQTGRLGTAENYRSALNSFRKFRRGEDLPLDALSAEVMERYEAWQKGRGLCPNTISFYARIFRAVYKRAVDDGVMQDRNPFKHIYTGVDKTVKRALSLPALKNIKRLDLSADDKLEYARDIFMMSFYLRGMSLVDMCFLRKSDLKNGQITYRRRKTGQRLTIAWTAQMQSIVDKYKETDSEYLLPIIPSNSCNKRSAYKNAGYRINRSLHKIGELVGEPAKLTLYRSRHSWCSLARLKGIPISVISEAMGHDSETTTQIYLASLETTAVDDANNLIISSL